MFKRKKLPITKYDKTVTALSVVLFVTQALRVFYVAKQSKEQKRLLSE